MFNAELSRRSAVRRIADGRPAFPCRISLTDAARGDEVILVNYEHHAVATPFRSATRGRKADLTIYIAGRRPPARGAVTLPPDIAIEVVSPSLRDRHRDREEKMDEYATFGIRFYWLVDPQQRTIEIHERAGGSAYTRRLEIGGGLVESVPGCPGLTLDLDAMWSADALEQQ